MKKHIPTLLALALSLGSPHAHAVGELTLDIANLAENVSSAIDGATATAKQAQQYVTQLEQYMEQVRQYENMVKNTAAPAVYVWDKANRTINELTAMASSVDYYKSKYGSIDGYMSKFQDVSYYRSSPCYGPHGCSADEKAKLDETIKIASAARKQANDAALKGLEQQQKQLDEDSRNLERLQSQAQTADGQMKALQAANQLASNQAAQLLQIRALLQQQQQILLAQSQAEADREARELASDEVFHGGTYTKSSGRTW
ncbi:hypothetical protein ANRL3_02783 [Anaerolineae bacterium]|nr:hypothetical protein ANRL3_02783 [Anaerolineae bacterium]